MFLVGKHLAFVFSLKADIRLEPFYFIGREILEEFQLFQAFDGASLSSVIADFLSLIEIEVGMIAKLVEGKLVDVELVDVFGINPDEADGSFRETVDFFQLLDRSEATKFVSVSYDGAGIVAADARNLHQFRGVGIVDGDVFARL